MTSLVAAPRAIEHRKPEPLKSRTAATADTGGCSARHDARHRPRCHLSHRGLAAQFSSEHGHILNCVDDMRAEPAAAVSTVWEAATKRHHECGDGCGEAFAQKKKALINQGFNRSSGGEGGIRTHGTGDRYTGFRVRRIRPLCHLSGRRCAAVEIETLSQIEVVARASG